MTSSSSESGASRTRTVAEVICTRLAARSGAEAAPESAISGRARPRTTAGPRRAAREPHQRQPQMRVSGSDSNSETTARVGSGTCCTPFALESKSRLT